jgi:hypothetical protein
MKPKPTLLVLLIAALALFAGACGSDSDESSDTTEKKETTTTEAESEEGGDEADEETTATVSDEEFEATITAFTDSITAANGDPCVIFAAVSATTEFPDPANPAQVEVALTVYDVMFGAIADSAPPEFAAQAEVIRNAGTQLQTDAEANGHEPAWFLETVGTVFNEGEVSDALDTYFAQTQAACSPTEPGAEAPSTTMAG